MNKKILLINPNWIKSKTTIWSKVASVYPLLGILNIAGVLEKEGHLVRFVDMAAENITPSELKIKNNYDIIGITMTSPLEQPAKIIAKMLKEKFPNTKIVIGGVHASTIHRKLIKEKYIDLVVREEGEVTMQEYCADKPMKEILGITYIDKNKIIVNPPRPQLKDITWLPMIPYHLLKMKLYKPPVGGYKKLPAFMMITTRNCPNDCTYCQHYHRRLTSRTAEQIFEEMKFLHEKYGIKEINFYDDTMTIFKQNIMKLCDLIIENKLDVVWTCFTRVNVVSEELLIKMKKAGCHLILFGVESSNLELLKAMRKNITLSQVEKAVKLCRKVGIKTRNSYIFGYPGETEQTMKDTFEFSKKVDSDTVQYNAITAYPGTDLWNQAEKNGWLIKTNEWDVSNCNIETKQLKRDQVLAYYKKAHRRYYLRPKIMIRRITNIRSFEDIKQEFNGLLAMISQ